MVRKEALNRRAARKSDPGMKMKWPLAVVAAMTLFAAQAGAAVPAGWFVAGDKPAEYTFDTDSAVTRDGARSAIIRAKTSNAPGFGTLMQTLSAQNYVGSRVRLSAYLRSEDVRRGQMWLRIDGKENKVLGFDNMDSRPITGSTEWKRYEIVLDVPEGAVALAFGFFLAGKGALWADSFNLEIVDKSVPVTAPGTPPGQRLTPGNLSFED
jgi:hypothetical protein